MKIITKVISSHSWQMTLLMYNSPDPSDLDDLTVTSVGMTLTWFIQPPPGTHSESCQYSAGCPLKKFSFEIVLKAL